MLQALQAQRLYKDTDFFNQLQFLNNQMNCIYVSLLDDMCQSVPLHLYACRWYALLCIDLINTFNHVFPHNAAGVC